MLLVSVDVHLVLASYYLHIHFTGQVAFQLLYTYIYTCLAKALDVCMCM